MLQESELSLTACLDMCHATEVTAVQRKSMKSDEASADTSVIFTCGIWLTAKKTKNRKFCGWSHVLRKEAFPAWGKTYKKCPTPNHFAVKCEQKKKKHLQVVTEYSRESEEEQLLAVRSILWEKTFKAEMIISATCQVDSGANVDVISSKHIKNAKTEKCKAKHY